MGGGGPQIRASSVVYHSVFVATGLQKTVCTSTELGSELIWNQNVALKLAEALARRLSRAESLIADLGLKDVGQRLAKEIMFLAQSGKPADEGIEVTVPLAWAEIAARIGTTPETLSRRLNAFADQGLIRLTGPRSLIVLRPLKLQAIAEQ